MKWYMPIGFSEADRALYDRVRARFQQLFLEANEPEEVALYHSVDVQGHVSVLGLNAAAGEHLPELLEEFNWSEHSSSLPFRFIWVAGDKCLNNYSKGPQQSL